MPKSRENKTCGQKSEKTADRTRSRQRFISREQLWKLGRHIYFRHKSCKHILPAASSLRSGASRTTHSHNHNLLYRAISSFCRPTHFLPAWPVNKNHWQIISVVVWFIIIKDDVATWNAISNNWESRATISISNIHFLEIKVFNNPGVVLVYYFVVSRVKAICVLRCDYKEVIGMMMRFYNSRVEHIVTKNNEFFE